MDLTLRDKAVLVTGGSRGIGRQIALDFAKEGASVAICARNPQKLEETLAELKALGGKCLAIQTDLFQADECRRVVDQTAEAFGRLDVLVNCASTDVSGTLETLTDEKLMERLNGKFLGAARCSRAAIPHMRRTGSGRIICIGGTASRFPRKGTMPSGISNAALANFAKCLSDDLAREGITVNLVHPTFSKTDRFPKRVEARARERGISLAEAEASLAADSPIGRVVEPVDVGPLVVFLASPLASAITGQAIAVDGGAARYIAY